MIKKLIISSLIAISFVACSSNSSSNSDGNNSDDNKSDDNVSIEKSGIFLDSAIKGMSYSTTTKKAVTDEEGTFIYINDENITFKIGGITIGSAKAQAVMTPLTLLNTDNAAEFKVVQMLQFLQSIDSDHNASNGITISDALIADADRVSYDFTGEVDLLDLFKSLDVKAKDQVREEDALGHFKKTLNEIHKPNYSKEFLIIAGVYEYNNTILDITSSGVINAYKYDTKYKCIKTIPSSHKAAYAMNGKTLTHDEDNKKFTLLINGKTSGWRYDKDDKIDKVFYGAKKASVTLEDTESDGSSVFITAEKSTRFTNSTEISGSNMCTGFEHLKGAYYDSVYDGNGDGYFCDKNASTENNDSTTLKDSEAEKKVQNSLIYIDNGRMRAYVMGTTDVNLSSSGNIVAPTRLCLRKVKQGDFNYRLNNVYLSKRVYKNTDAGIEMEYFYKNKSNDEKVSCIVNADGNFIKVAYEGAGEKSIETNNTIVDFTTSGVAVVNGHIPSLNGMLTIVNDNYALTVKKDDGTGVADINGTGDNNNTLGVKGTPPLYTDENIEKSWCP
jgi:hypothetical protein